MWKSIVSIVIAFVLLGLLALGGLYRAKKLDLGFLRDVNTHTYQFVQNYAYQAGTATLDKKELTKVQTYADSVIPRTLTPADLITNKDLSYGVTMRHYPVAYLQSGGDPNNIVHINDYAGDFHVPVMDRLLGYTFTERYDFSRYDYETNTLLLLHLLHQTGYTNWNWYGKEHHVPALLYIIDSATRNMIGVSPGDDDHRTYRLNIEEFDTYSNILTTFVRYGGDVNILPCEYGEYGYYESDYNTLMGTVFTNPAAFENARSRSSIFDEDLPTLDYSAIADKEVDEFIQYTRSKISKPPLFRLLVHLGLTNKTCLNGIPFRLPVVD